MELLLKKSKIQLHQDFERWYHLLYPNVNQLQQQQYQSNPPRKQSEEKISYLPAKGTIQQTSNFENNYIKNAWNDEYSPSSTISNLGITTGDTKVDEEIRQFYQLRNNIIQNSNNIGTSSVAVDSHQTRIIEL